MPRFIKRASHGTRAMSPQEIKNKYKRELVSLRNESRYEFLNTLFSVSEAVLYMQVGSSLPPPPADTSRAASQPLIYV